LTRRIGLALALAAALAGCESGTGGALVSVVWGVRVVGGLEVPLDGGGTLTLSTARLSVGPLYGFERSPPQAPNVLDRVLGLFVGVAHAHAGDDFFAGGVVVAEWLEPRVVDLTVPSHTLGPMPAQAGPLRSATLHLLPHRDLDDATLRLEGLVTREGAATPAPFSLALDLSGSFEDRRVDFVEASGTLTEGARVFLEANPRAWFAGARFEEAALQPLDPQGQSASSVRINLRRARTWRVVVDD
jgi:hypothetical protein